MKLSVIIVNYNVEYFLEQCLYSVRNATKNIPIEIIVVDNNSVDGSEQMVMSKFPEVSYIANKVNVGFSTANNQAIRISRGEYVLLLNPDTIVQEDTFIKCIDFMDRHPDCGGLGVKMVDGKGDFLPESKRGLPTPEVAFYKIFGLASFFPKSKRFGKYHLSYLDKDETHEVDVLAGAFMLMPKKVLDEIGLLDETFFMYGEDIDLSYRITKGGYKNYYYPETRIIHYKGESTKKGSMNYVFMFYNAMIIFAKKHFSKKNIKLFSLLINIAIYLRAGVAIIGRVLNKSLIPGLDFIFTFAGLYFITQYWGSAYIDSQYPEEFIKYFLPTYSLTWIVSIFFSGGYDKPYNLLKINRGILIGSIIILSIYGLLDEEMRYSRFIIISGAFACIILTNVVRLIAHTLSPKRFPFERSKNKRYVIVGSKEETLRVANLLHSTNASPGFVGIMSADFDNFVGGLGNISQLKEIIRIYSMDEVIFCSKDISAINIIDQMSDLQELNIDYKIAPQEGVSIIGSNSINTSGELYTIEVNPINNFQNKRNKRVLDIVLCMAVLIVSPYLVFKQRKPLKMFSNVFNVAIGNKSWVGFNNTHNDSSLRLPNIRKGVLTITDAITNDKLTDETIRNLNLLYAREYSIKADLKIVVACYNKLDK